MDIHQKPGSLATEPWQERLWREPLMQPYEGNTFTPWNTMLQASYNIIGYRILFADGVATAILFHGVNQELFHALITVQIKTERWRRWYNEERPHRSLVPWSASDCCYSTGTGVPYAGRI